MHLVKPQEIPKLTHSPLDDMDLIGVFKLCNRMEQICLDNDGIGLSAVQIGLPLNLFIIKRNKFFEHYVDCNYEPAGETITSVEGCLSLKDDSGSPRRFKLKRHSSVFVKGQRIDSSDHISIEDFSSFETGLYSIVFQHEIDHSYGILISDKGQEIYIS